MLNSFKRVIQWGLQNFTRNSGASFATASVMLVVVILVTGLFLLNYVAEFAIAELRDRLALSVYFKPEASEQEILRAKRQLEKEPGVERVEYVSRDAALEKFSQRHQNNPLIQRSLAMVGSNPLLAHLDVKAKNPADYQNLSAKISDVAFSAAVDHFNYTQVSPIIERVERITAALNSAGLALAIVFGLIAALVTFNTVRLAIYNLREEIGVMRLVGAANMFIRGPLLFQAVLAGFIAAGLGLLLFGIGLSVVSERIALLVPGLDLFGYFINNLGRIVSLQLLASIGLGIFSSWIAMRRYLMV